jgi:hypothetical protein
MGGTFMPQSPQRSRNGLRGGPHSRTILPTLSPRPNSAEITSQSLRWSLRRTLGGTCPSSLVLDFVLCKTLFMVSLQKNLPSRESRIRAHQPKPSGF